MPALSVNRRLCVESLRARVNRGASLWSAIPVAIMVQASERIDSFASVSRRYKIHEVMKFRDADANVNEVETRSTHVASLPVFVANHIRLILPPPTIIILTSVIELRYHNSIAR